MSPETMGIGRVRWSKIMMNLKCSAKNLRAFPNFFLAFFIIKSFLQKVCTAVDFVVVVKQERKRRGGEGGGNQCCHYLNVCYS